MNDKKRRTRIGLSGNGLLAAICLLCLSTAFAPVRIARAQPLSDSLDPNPPSTVVKLIFIHHSTGQNWLDDGNGGLGLALSNNNYFVSDTNYGWGPNLIGSRTDIPEWLEWFRSADTPTIMAALYAESGQNSTYTRTHSDPGGENEIIMFKSCFPNSALEGNPDDPPSADGGLTVGHAKYVYNQLLLYFQNHPEKLFVVITAPPLIDGTYAANARAFNQWLYNDWLSGNGYTLPNVAVFDFYNVLTGPDNHHRYYGGAIQHVFTPGLNTEYYPSGDDHPSRTGNLKATSEFIPMLNIFYHRWKGGVLPGAFAKTAPANGVYAATAPALSWGPSSGATSYIYCIDTVNNNACDTNWVSAGAATSVTLSGLTNRSIYYWEVVASNSKGITYADGGTWWSFVARTVSFADVPSNYWAWMYIEMIYANGITSGCNPSPLDYCPGYPVTREQMAVFILKSEHGGSYTPPAMTGVFSDVPIGYWAGSWIEQLYHEGITSGCSQSPLNFCPASAVTREQMAVFLMKGEHGSSYTPPAMTGVFSDVPIGYWAGTWIEQLYHEGITSGCSQTPLMYCPASAVTRDQMAVFLVKTFHLLWP